MSRESLTLHAVTMVHRPALIAAAAVVVACAAPASAADRNWASPQIAAVTRAGILAPSAAAFRPDAPLTQSALADAVRTADGIQHPPDEAPTPSPVRLLSTLGPGAVASGTAPIVIDAPDRLLDHVAFAVDGTGVALATADPYEFDLDTTRLGDGPHRLAVNAAFAGGGSAVAVWTITVANAGGALPSGPGAFTELPIARASVPPTDVAATTAPAVRPVLYRATAPAQPVTVKQLDAALVAYAGLATAARAIQTTLARAGLHPPAHTGSEAIARLLGLRFNHPASDDGLELLPSQAATRAEAAWSFAQLLRLDPATIDAVGAAAAAFTLPVLSPWQQRILLTAVHYVGYPYVWGGTSPTAQTLFGIRSAGGFDCSGFVWRVYKLTPYPDEGSLAGVLRGRTTYELSGEVPRHELIPAAELQPGDVMFFGRRGPKSKPAQVDHAALYLGNGWLIQSSGEGVTLLPFDGWYTRSFAWGRRPLQEAGLG